PEEQDDIQETIGIEYSTFNFTAANGAKIKFQIWDGSGNPIYKSSIIRYCEGVHVVVFTYDMNDISSLNEVIEWNNTLKEHKITSNNTIFIMVGNKLDLLADPKLNQK